MRARLAGLEVVACGLAHERVRREPGSLLPVRDPIEPDHGYRRVAYCTADTRRRRVACAHTMARQALRDALEALAARAAAGPASLARSALELDALELRLYAIDRRKSDLEIAHARLSDPARAGGDAQARAASRRRVDAALARLVRAHDRLVWRLGAQRDALLARIDALELRVRGPESPACGEAVRSGGPASERTGGSSAG